MLGLLLMVAAGGSLYLLLGSRAFELDRQRIEVSQLRYTDSQLVEDTLEPWLAGGANAFSLRAVEIQRALAGLPAVASAQVDVRLPDRLVVWLIERVPVFVWRNGGDDYLVDSSGVLLRAVLPDEALPDDLPLIADGRRRAEPARAGDVLEAVDLHAVLKLGAVEPALLDSAAQWLSLSVDERDGYVLAAEPGGWRAVFGHYTPNLRPPDIIERQVQCLRALLAEDEPALRTIYLAPAEERCGTYVARSTPEPSREPGDGEQGDE